MTTSYPIREFVLRALRPHLMPGARVLEIGSGSGLHAVHLAYRMPDVIWQPSERPAALAELVETCAALPLANVATPLPVDPAQGPWPTTAFDAVVVIDADSETMAAVVAEAPSLLRPGGILFTYDAVDGGVVRRFDETPLQPFDESPTPALPAAWRRPS